MTNMNSENRSIAINYLLARDGRCCTTKNGHGCGKTFSQLVQDAKDKEEQTGKERKLPIIYVDCVDNSGDHKIDIHKSLIMQNFQLLCTSCNRKKNPHKAKTTQASGRKPSREKLDNLRFEPEYHRNLKTFLQDNQEGCFIEIMMNSKNFSGGGNQITCKRYFDDHTITAVNKKGIYQKFPFECKSENCNGVHVCLVGLTPKRLIELEHQQLESKWWNDYGSLRDVWKTKSNLALKHFMDLEEYIETHGNLIVHEFL